MKSRHNLKPGQKGTKKLVEEYGKSLLYVRYRYDESRGIRLKTVEIVVEEKPWQPSTRLRDEGVVSVPVTYAAEHLIKDNRKVSHMRCLILYKMLFVEINVPFG